MSSVWLLSWNPKNWKWDKYSEWCVGTKIGERFIESWTCHSKKPAVGDEFYLIKLGEKLRGLIGHGYIARESYSAPHYDYEQEKFIDQEYLKNSFPDQNWSPQGYRFAKHTCL